MADALLPSSASGMSPKISTILQSHVYPRFGRVLRALARVKAKWKQQQQHSAIGCGRSKKKTRNSGRQQQQAAATTSSGGGGGGIASNKRPPHLTMSGDDGLSPARTALDVDYHVYPSCESVWNAVVVPAASAPGEYCGYLRWLEEELPDEVAVVEEDDDEAGEEAESDDAAAAGGNEIDQLAEQFIARCRANFLLEKQESYDRCQEMIARSL